MSSFTSKISLLAAFVAAGSFVVVAQVPVVDPNAVCPWQVIDQINTCRVQVYNDENALPGGPCYTTDWPCICNVQQGLLDCYAPCPGNTPQTDVDYNNGQCNGQNGYTNAQAGPGGVAYNGSVLTTTLPAGFDSATFTSGLSSTAVSSEALTSSVEEVSTTTTSSAAVESITSVQSGSSTTADRVTSTLQSSASPPADSRPQAGTPQNTQGSVFNGAGLKGQWSMIGRGGLCVLALSIGGML